MAGDDFTVEADVVLDDANFDAKLNAAFERMFDKLEKFDDGIGRVGKALDNLADRLDGRVITEQINRMDRAMKDFGDTGRRVGADFGRVFVGDAFGNIREQSQRATRGIKGDFDGLVTRLGALDTKFDELIRDAKAFGATEAQLNPLKTGLRDLARLQDRLNSETAQYGEVSETTLKEVRRQYEIVSRSLSAQEDIAQRFARERLQNERLIGSQRINEEISTGNRINEIIKSDGKERAVQAQTDGQKELAILKRQGQQRVQLTRFILESAGRAQRSLADTLRQSLSIIGRFTSQIGTRLESGYRRAFGGAADGITAGGNRSERALNKTFLQQESIISRSSRRQAALIARTTAATSTGLAGIATGNSRVGAALGGGLAIGGGFAVFQNLREGFEETVDLNEALNKTRVIFGDASQAVVDFSENAVESLFITKSQALEAASNFAIFGKQAGLTGPALSGFSTELLTLATDLSSFNNVPVEDTILAIGAALRGESEPISRFGVDTRVAALETAAFNAGITDSVRELTAQEKILAVNAQLFAVTGDAQGDAARTADDFANSSKRAGAALTTFFAAVVAKAVPVAEVITNVAFPALQGLTRFIEGDVGPALLVLRDGLIGAAAALGTLVAAKAALETLKFLRIGLTALTTPLGLFVSGFALAGAGIAILAKRSPELSDALGNLKTTLVDAVVGLFSFGKDGVGTAQDGLGRLATFINTEVTPRITDFVNAFAGKIQPALQAFRSFITSEVIPAVTKLATTIFDGVTRYLPSVLALVERVVAGVRRFATTVAETIEPFTSAIQGFFTTIRDAASGLIGSGFLGQIKDAFQGLATGGGLAEFRTAIADAFRGDDFDAFRKKLGDAFGGLKDLVLPVLKDIGSALASGLDAAVDGIGKFLSSTVLGALRGALEEAAFQITNILTDPRLIGVVVIAGALIGASLIKGIARGILNNVRQLIDIIQDKFGGALFDGILEGLKGILPALAVGLAGLAGINLLLNKIGVGGGAAFSKGFLQSSLSGIRGGLAGTRGFAGGLLGTQGGVGNLFSKNQAAEVAKQQTQLGRLNSELSRFGQGVVKAKPGVNGLSDAIRQAQGNYDTLTGSVGKARLAGERIRQSIGNVGSSFKQFGGEVRTAGQAAGAGFQTSLGQGLKQGGGGLKTAVSGLASNLRTSLGTAFSAVNKEARDRGQAIGGALVGGIGSVISGQQLGSATSAVGKGLGLAGILSSAIFAGLAVGGPAGGAVGAAVGGIGLVTAAFESNRKKAEEAEGRIRAYGDAFSDILKLVDGGASSISNEDFSEFSKELVDRLTESVSGESDVVLALLAKTAQESGVNFAEVIVDGVGRGLIEGSDIPSDANTREILDRALNPILSDLESAVDSSSELRGTFGDFRGRILNQILAGDDGGLSLRDSEALKEFSNLSDADIDAIDEALKLYGRSIGETVAGFTTEGDIIQITGYEVGLDGITIVDGEQAISDAAQELFGGEAFIGEIPFSVAALPTVSSPAASIIQGEIEKAIGEIEVNVDVGPSVAQNQIDLVTEAAEAARGELDRASEALEKFLNPDSANAGAIASTFSDFTSDLEGFNETAGEASFNIAANVNPVINQDLLNGALDGISTSAREVLVAGASALVNGEISLADYGSQVVEPLRQAVRDSVADQVLQDAIIAQIDAASSEAAVLVSAELDAESSATFATELENLLNNDELVEISSEISLKEGEIDQIVSLINEVKPEFFAELSDDPTARQAQVGLVVSAFQDSFDSSGNLVLPDDFDASGAISGASAAGVNVGNAFASGITTTLSAVANAAIALGARAERELRTRLRIQSPSKIFKTLGEDTADGFRIGIIDGLDELATTLGEAVNRLLDTALDSVAGRKNAIGSALVDLFGASGAGGGFAGQAGAIGGRLGVFEAIQGALGSVDSNYEELANLMKELNGTFNEDGTVNTPGRRATAAEQFFLNRAGDVKGLDTNTIFGLRNQQAIGSAIDAIRGEFEANIAKGTSVEQATQIAKGALNSLRANLLGVFGPGSTILRVIDSFGLNEESLRAFAELAGGLEGQARTIREERAAEERAAAAEEAAARREEEREKNRLGVLPTGNISISYNVYPQNLDSEEMSILAGDQLVQRAIFNSR